jgi:hypothetical protein
LAAERTNDLRCGERKVSREHAEVAPDGARFLIRDKAVAGTARSSTANKSRIEIRSATVSGWAEAAAPDLVFLTGDEERSGMSLRSSTGRPRRPAPDHRVCSEGFRALAPGRVLQEVLALVLGRGHRDFQRRARRSSCWPARTRSSSSRMARGRQKQTLT